MPLVGGGSINVSFTGEAAQLVSEVQRVSKSLDDFSKKRKAQAAEEEKANKQSASSYKTTFTEISSAIGLVKQGLGVMKGAFDFAKEGAMLEFTKQKFDNLSNSIGTTSEKLMGELKTATGGIYSDMELMAKATDLVGLGLANTSDEAVRLAKVAGGLNMNMNDLVLTLTNMGTRRFDQLGVRVDGFKEKVKALKDSGMDANAAFKEAFLQQAEAQLALVGSAADTTAGSFMRLESNAKNAMDVLKETAATALEPLINKWNEHTETSDKTRMAVAAYNEKMLETGGTMVLSRATYNVLKDKVLEYAHSLDVAAASEAHIARDDFVGSMQEKADAIGMTEEQSKNYMSVLKTISGETEKFTEKNQDLNDKLDELQDKLSKERKGSKAYKDLQGEIEATKTAVTELADEHAQASKSMMFDLISQQAAAEGFKNISVEALSRIGEEWGVLAKGSGDATSTMISQAEAWSQALSLPEGQMQSLATMWLNLAKLSKTGIKFTAQVVSQATGGAMGGQNTMTQCFTGDTLVTMADGSSVAIRDVFVGDAVLSRDVISGQNIKTIVTETFQHPASEGGRLLLINGYLKVTPEHLLYNGHTWKPAGEFTTDDVLINLDGSHMRVTSVREIVKNEPVYNIHVDNEVHNYFAGGVLVHNAKQNDVTTQWQGGKVGNYATGGQGGGWGIVGDRQGGGWVDGVSELVFGNFQVYPSKQAKALLKSGMLGKVKGFAYGSEDLYTNAGNIATKPIIPASVKVAGQSKTGGGSSSAPVSQAVMQQAVQQNAEMQVQIQAVANQAQAQITNMVVQLQQSQAAAQSVFEDMLAVLRNENPRAIGKQVAYELAKSS